MLRKLYFVFLLNMAVKGAVGKSLNEDTSSSSEIIGGKDVDIKQYPHQIAILDDDLRFFCSGSILSENYVLTAAHCPETSKETLEAESRSVQYGIVSFGSPQCDTPKLPNVYTYIPAVRGWIQEVTGI